ncbi:hypothetical protein DL768_006917 [Monosporascus sp. mg162]|nr:hypothetical protein DL768_006917 [Monosporascus sp. mg162]
MAPTTSKVPDSFISSTTNDIPGYRVVEVKGTVYGLVARSRSWWATLGTLLKSIGGGELQGIKAMLYDARNDALRLLAEACSQKKGNAIIGLRFDTTDLGAFTQVCAYGTACVVERINR